MRTMKTIAVFVVVSVLGVPTLSLAKAGGSYRGGGGYSGSRGGGMSSGSMGSRGSRTHEQNGYKPIEPSTTPNQPANGAQPAGRPMTPQSPPLQAASQPSFLQRHPVLSGLAAGIAGSWIGHMLFGATDTSARTTNQDGTVNESQRDAEPSGGSSGSMGMLLLLMALGAGALYYFFKVRRTEKLLPSFTRLGGGHAGLRTQSEVLQTASYGSPNASAEGSADVTSADEQQFCDLCVQIQTAWGRQDLDTLRKATTPEMLHYFTSALSEHASQEVENLIEDVTVTNADVRESWTEDASTYATVLLHWKARDYTVSLGKQSGEPGSLLEGDRETPKEMQEVWTFMRHQRGKWVLSAIQQV